MGVKKERKGSNGDRCGGAKGNNRVQHGGKCKRQKSGDEGPTRKENRAKIERDRRENMRESNIMRRRAEDKGDSSGGGGGGA